MPLPRSAWNKVLRTDSPSLGFRSSLLVQPLKGEAKEIRVEHGGEYCREQIIRDVRQGLERKLFSPPKHGQEAGTWKPIILHPATKLGKASLKLKPATLFADLRDEDYYGEREQTVCTRGCCLGGLIHTLNAVVSLPCLLLSPGRKGGSWWKSSPKHFKAQSLTYNGVDNFFLAHPALVSLTLGLFRQAIGLHTLGLSDKLSKAVPEKELERVLGAPNAKEALRLVQKARPWIEASTPSTGFPVGQGQWDRFLKLHQAVYQHGLTKVFGEIETAWNLGNFQRQDVVKGFRNFYEDKKAEKRVAGLAKKA